MFSLSNFYKLLGVGVYTINKETVSSINNCVVYDPQYTHLQSRFTIPDCIDMDDTNCIVVKYDFEREKITKTLDEIYDNNGSKMRVCKVSDLGSPSITKYQNSIQVDCMEDPNYICNFDVSLKVSNSNPVCPVKFEMISQNKKDSWSVDNCPTTIFPNAYQKASMGQLIEKWRLGNGLPQSITKEFCPCEQVS